MASAKFFDKRLLIPGTVIVFRGTIPRALILSVGKYQFEGLDSRGYPVAYNIEVALQEMESIQRIEMMDSYWTLEVASDEEMDALRRFSVSADKVADKISRFPPELRSDELKKWLRK